MKQKIKCSECKYCDEREKWRNTRNEYYCGHPDQKYITDYFRQRRMRKTPGFLDFGKPGEVPVKTSPAWCPKKKEM